jgi:hypothetical protein
VNFVKWKLKKNIIEKIKAHGHYAKISAFFVIFAIILLAESNMIFQTSRILSIVCIIFAAIAAYTAYNVAYFRVFEIEPITSEI